MVSSVPPRTANDPTCLLQNPFSTLKTEVFAKIELNTLQFDRHIRVLGWMKEHFQNFKRIISTNKEPHKSAGFQDFLLHGQ